MRETPNIPEGLSTRIAALDGLRGLAILSVMVYHFIRFDSPVFVDRLVARAASIGWVGVDLFFVLSGFLITGILIDTRNGRSYFRTFFIRRALRIFPLYYTFLVLLIVIAPRLWPQSLSLQVLDANQVWYWLHATNVLVWLNGWEAAPLSTHLWSLAVEEQFYLVWPLLVWAMPPRVLPAACLVVAGASVGSRLILRSLHDPMGSYVLTFCRLDSLAFGALLAALVRREDALRWVRRFAQPLAALAGAVLFAAFVQGRGLKPGSVFTQSAGFTLLALVFAAIIAMVVTGAGPSAMTRLCERPLLQHMGRYSYAMYVVHVPVLKLVEISPAAIANWPTVQGSQLPGQAGFLVLCMAATWGIAWLSWHGFEQHWLRLKRYFPQGGLA